MLKPPKSNHKVFYNLCFSNPGAENKNKKAPGACNNQDTVIPKNLPFLFYNAYAVSKDASKKQCGYNNIDHKPFNEVLLIDRYSIAQ